MAKEMAMGADPKLPPGTNYCRCGACGEYFKSVSGFDMHRIDSGCLTRAEMLARGMSVNERGYFVTQAWSEQVPLGRDAA